MIHKSSKIVWFSFIFISISSEVKSHSCQSNKFSCLGCGFGGSAMNIHSQLLTIVAAEKGYQSNSLHLSSSVQNVSASLLS